MDSPLVRVILATLGGYFIILLLFFAYDWIAAEYPRRPTQPPGSERVRHPFYREKAAEVLQRFARLPESDQAAVKANLQSSLISVEQWLTRLGRSDLQIICLGELHEESTRAFLAEEFFAKFRTDVLLLEATPGNLKRLVKRMEAGRDYFPLLEADILNILRAVRGRNPAVEIWGIEQTAEQQEDAHGRSNPRDQSIARNFWNRYRPGRRHVILYGALHCANEPNWLFGNLCSRADLALKKRMVNVHVLGEKQNGPLEAFVYFLDAIGMKKSDFVIADTGALHPLVRELFRPLNRQTLGKYCSLLVFRI